MTVKSFPGSLVVKDRVCWILGGGREATDKGVKLARAGAQVKVIAETFSPAEREIFRESGISVEERAFSVAELTDQFFVILTIKGNPGLTKQIAARCREKRILLCAIDQPAFCDIVNVAVFERGALRISVSTEGVSPALARKIREGLESSLKDTPIEGFLEELGKLRESLEKSNAVNRIDQLIEAVRDVKFEVKFSIPQGK